MRELTMDEMDVVSGGEIDPMQTVTGARIGGGGVLWVGTGSGGYLDFGFEEPEIVVTASENATIGPIGSDADIWVKSGANIDNIRNEIRAALMDIKAIADSMGLPHPVITSGNDSRHMRGSLHYHNLAIDLRGNNITVEQGRAFAAELSRSLGGNYDIQFEVFRNRVNNHTHIEFDP